MQTVAVIDYGMGNLHSVAKALEHVGAGRVIVTSDANVIREADRVVFRPHPRDSRWRERFAPAMGVNGAAVQSAGEVDLRSLAVMREYGGLSSGTPPPMFGDRGGACR